MKSVYRSYSALTPKTRAIFGLGVMLWGGLGLWSSSRVEGALGMSPSQQEKEELERKLAVRVETVDR